MKNTLLVAAILLGNSFALAKGLICVSNTETFVFKNASDRLYLVYECNSNLTQCTSPAVFEGVGFEDDKTFDLRGLRANGQRTTFVVNNSGKEITASMQQAYTQKVLDLLTCKRFEKLR